MLIWFGVMLFGVMHRFLVICRFLCTVEGRLLERLREPSEKFVRPSNSFGGLGFRVWMFWALCGTKTDILYQVYFMSG